MTQTDRDTHHVLDQKNQYHQNGFTTQNNLQIQWNSYQITYGIFHWTGEKKKTYNLYERGLKYPEQYWERKMELEESDSLTSDNSTKLP